MSILPFRARFLGKNNVCINPQVKNEMWVMATNTARSYSATFGIIIQRLMADNSTRTHLPRSFFTATHDDLKWETKSRCNYRTQT